MVVGERRFLGELEQMVLAACLRLGDDAYGVRIIQEIEAATGRAVSGGSLYVTLNRLEDKRLLESRLGAPEPGRGGRPKRYVRVTQPGVAALQEAREAMLGLWNGIEERLERGRP